MSWMAFPLFLLGRFTGSFILRVTKAHNMLGLYSFINVMLMFVIVANLGWISVAAVFLSFFFMSIMFPTIFSLGIFGLGEKSKMASSFIVMAIMGGAVLPKVMGAIGDKEACRLDILFRPSALWLLHCMDSSGLNSVVRKD